MGQREPQLFGQTLPCLLLGSGALRRQHMADLDQLGKRLVVNGEGAQRHAVLQGRHGLGYMYRKVVAPATR